MKAASDEPISLPVTAQSRDGLAFRPQEDVWRLVCSTRKISINFHLVRGVNTQLLSSLKATLSWYAQNMSADHTYNIFQRFRHFFRTLGADRVDWEQITADDIINYRSKLSERTGWYLGHLAGGMRRWKSLGYPGIDASAIKLLDSLRIGGNLKGEAVLTMDPQHGPFTEIELQAIHSALNEAYATGRVDRQEYLLCWLFLLFGARSVQLAALKVCDLVVDTLGDGTPAYNLRMPRAKQRNQLIRTEFKIRPLVRDIGDLLAEHAKWIASSFAIRLEDPLQAPLFFLGQPSEAQLPGFSWHCTSKQISDALKATLNSLKPMSERTGQPIHITATRFRRTLGTRAAMEGHGEFVIAELLDHSDTQSVGVYVEATPAIVDRIDKAIALQMAPLAQAFAGLLIDSAQGDGNKESVIADPRFARHPIGNCGKHGFCAFAAPIACYPCRNFQPWLDGPHEAVLDFLLAERERLIATSDACVATINDRIILAVAEVVRLCAEHHAANGDADG